ncbi:hypothetical protein CE91St62_31400 [Lachnospiraceae bacterium]|uniref:Nif11-like leader peptide family natural product precursor n=1 Tax=Extibacter sp. GGCC_0201 TaxID=2731209 RepID=UPI001AA0FDF2|nr:Nif11-like leader peptide family natural product precursor [Extibacter sp. GGCC_0201]MBO1721865.1 Nif11 family protein [Extibacter sp. GGCC_0201]BDF35078.1 hypothetical protein CE91St61_31530 [Lachnospiraceae bacterium]BDF39079.1 hypothetical protein CE91St62_31400 [Lachnospiraceae bacterium]
MTMQEFMKKMETFDKNIYEKFKSCKTPEEVYKAAQELGLSAGYDEFMEEVKRLHDQQMKMTDADIKTIVGSVDVNRGEAEVEGTLSTMFVAMLAAL